MYKIKIKENEYEMKNSLDELDYDTYFKVQELILEEDYLERLYKLWILLTNIPEDLIQLISMDEMLNIDLNWCFEVPELDIKYEYFIGEEKYFINKNLDNLSYAEYIDGKNFLMQKDYAKLIAMLLRISEGDDYDSKLINNLSEKVKKEMKVMDIISISNFFLNGQKGLIIVLMTLFQKQYKMMGLKLEDIKVKDGE